MPRNRNKAWQAYALTYLRTGEATISTRFRPSQGFSKATARTVASWPVLAKSGRYALRVPQPEPDKP